MHITELRKTGTMEKLSLQTFEFSAVTNMIQCVVLFSVYQMSIWTPRVKCKEALSKFNTKQKPFQHTIFF